MAQPPSGKRQAAKPPAPDLRGSGKLQLGIGSFLGPAWEMGSEVQGALPQDPQ